MFNKERFMKNIILYTVSSIMLVCFLLLASCSDPFNPIENENNGYGKIAVNIAREKTIQENARTTFPSTTFDRYVYIFTKTDEATGIELNPDNNGFFHLEIGSYTVTVMAYNSNTLVAIGVSSQFNVNSGNNASVVVHLESVNSNAKGQLNYKITYPIGSVAEIKLYAWPFQDEIILSPRILIEENGINEILELQYGSYILSLTVNKDGHYAGISEAIHITSSIITEYTKNFIENDFRIFNPITSITGVPTFGYPHFPITLTGTINPNNATFYDIIKWSIQNSGTTGALINGNILTAQNIGTVTVRATISNGNLDMSPYTQDFNIEIKNTTLAERLMWIKDNIESDMVYVLDVTDNEIISSQNLYYPGKNNVTIHLTSSGGEKIISFLDNGALFWIEEGVTLILDNNITLRGHENNNSGALVRVYGNLIMKSGAKITGNGKSTTATNIYGGGAMVYSSGNFLMEGGEISGNGNSLFRNIGSAVCVYGTFTMKDGKISGNASSDNNGAVYVIRGTFNLEGGEISNNNDRGVLIIDSGRFTMKGGKISGNNEGVSIMRSAEFIMDGGEITGHSGIFQGGGVYLNDGNFIMRNGIISGNRATYAGGGVYVAGSFTMEGGEISSNTVGNENTNSINASGGGVAGSGDSTFTKTGGIIYGYTAGDTKSNRVISNGVIQNNKGHAVNWFYVIDNKDVSFIRDNTLGVNDYFSTKLPGATVNAPSSTSSVTTNSITINPVASPINGQTVEYSILLTSSGYTWQHEWQVSTTFTGLSHSTTYYIFARAKQNNDYNDGTISTGFQVTTSAIISTVSSVVVSPSNVSVIPGQTQQFNAIVHGTNNPAQTVTWSVTGGGSGTSINTNGLLTVSNSENAASLTVRATSTVNTSVSGTVIVKNIIPLDNWTSVSNSTIGYGRGIVYGNGRFVAVGSEQRGVLGWVPKIIYSIDGVNWVAGQYLEYGSDIAYGNNMYVVCGSFGYIAYSSNGVIWTDNFYDKSGLFTSNDHIETICYGNGRFVVGYGNKIAYSTDGRNWIAAGDSTFPNASTNDILSITYGDGKFIAVGQNGHIAYSSNGINWSAVSNKPFSNNIWGVTYGNGKFVIVGQNGRIAYSSDGINWSNTSSAAFTGMINSISFGNGRFVAGGANGRMAYSSDGINWTTIQNSSFGSESIVTIAYGAGKFVAVGYDGKIAWVEW